MHKIARVLTLASLTVIALGAGLGVGFAATATVAIGTTLHPATLTVQPGTSVTWVNNDDERHRMRSRNGPVEWDSNDLEPGDTYAFTFTVEGSYPYLDERDDENTAYHGTVVVAGPSGGGTGGGTGGGGDGTAPAPSSAAVRIFDKSFIPGTVTIATGGTVTWSNDDDTAHTVNASSGGFASGTMSQGEKFSRKFTSAGTFNYFCAFHSDMKGTVRVQSASGTVPPPTAATGGTGGSTSAAAPIAGAPGQSGVSIVDFAFTPPTVRIRAGDTVAWANRGRAPHTVTAEDGSFDSGILEPSATFRRVFPKEGSFAYACALHPNMTGTVLVGAAARAAASPSSAVAATQTPTGEAMRTNGSVLGTGSQQGAGLSTAAFLGVVLGIPGVLLVGSTLYLLRTNPTKG